MTHPAVPPEAAAPLLADRQMLAPLGATLAVCALLLAWSAGQQPILGDESSHFHKAVCFFQAPWPAMRLANDPAYPPDEVFGTRYSYWDSCGWHLGLATIWKFVGRPSPFVAQLYQAAFVLLLGLMAFLCGRELYGPAGGWWTWALAMSLPINILLGMTFYLELPAAAMCALAVYAILRRRPLLLAVGLAGMFYIKQPSAAVLAGPLILAAFFRLGDTWRQRAGRTALALVVALALLGPDLLWRQAHFGQAMMFTSPSPAGMDWIGVQLPPGQRGPIPMNIVDPVMAVETLGATGLAALAAAALWSVWLLGRALLGLVRRLSAAGRRAWPTVVSEQLSGELLVAAIPLLAFIAAYIVMLRHDPDVRYFYPGLFFVLLLGGGLLARADLFRRLGSCRRLGRVAAALLLLAMLGQTLVVPYYIHQRRTLAPTTAAGFDWIRQHVPPDARIVYPEFNLVALTGRTIIWADLIGQYFFNVSQPQQMRELRYLKVQYIAVPPNRFVATATLFTSPLGYPRPWARSLSHRTYLTRVFPDHPVEPGSGEFVLYRIEWDKVPAEWLARPMTDFDKDTPEGRPGGESEAP